MLTKENVINFPYAEKWLSKEEICHKLSNQFLKTPQTMDAQITQLLKFRFAQ